MKLWNNYLPNCFVLLLIFQISLSFYCFLYHIIPNKPHSLMKKNNNWKYLLWLLIKIRFDLSWVDKLPIYKRKENMQIIMLPPTTYIFEIPDLTVSFIQYILSFLVDTLVFLSRFLFSYSYFILTHLKPLFSLPHSTHTNQIPNYQSDCPKYLFWV